MIRTDTQTANDEQEDHLVSLTLPVQDENSLFFQRD
jgi:hypothetical protein